jgi:hypothetical protein
MSSGSRRALAVGVDRLQPGDHAFLAFCDDEERWEILRTFTQRGFARDERVILLVDASYSPDEVAARVASGVTATLAVDSGRLVVSATPRFGPGAFDAKRLVAEARAGVDAAVRAGYCGMRAASEMSLALAPVDRLKQAMEYETLLHETLFAGQAARRCTAMCMWDERLFRGEPTMDAVRAIHPVTVLSQPGTLHVAVTTVGVRLTGDSDMATREEFTAALRVLALRPAATLVLDIADLSFLDVYSASRVLRLAAGLVPPRRLEVRCRNMHRRMLHALGARSVAQLSIVTERL